ncbi:MAG: UDP-3-O-acyl-N-acetylglucosamine deacetylase [Deltaproteobacteria bacterium]|nr:UDP-3-O-acyl-N-acetylglucosamine deacetylase [Deltaproteobacteria bacterium]
MAHILLNISDMNGIRMQKTIENKIEFSGIGLHTGHEIRVRILPANENTGIVFVRSDVPSSPIIRARAENVVATSYATTLGRKGVTVSTVEHLLAAFYGMGVDNARVELDGPEVPIMDGSASEFISMIESSGLKDLSAPKKYLVIKEPIRVADRDKCVEISPSGDDEFTVDYSIDFAHPFITKQSFSGLFSGDVFRDGVGRARTFGFLSDYEMLKKNGLAKGGSLDNAIVIGDNEILNEEGLRYPDEFVRHKVLDLMGDISLLGFTVIGQLKAHRSGHALNFKLVQEILRWPESWVLTEAPSKEEPASAGCPLVEKMATV